MTKTTLLKPALIATLLFLTNLTLHAQDLSIIPKPQKLTIGNGHFKFSSSTRIFYDESCKNEANYLKLLLSNEHHLTSTLNETQPKQTNQKAAGVYFIINRTDSTSLGKEGYKLQVNHDQIIIKAANSAGAFYAIQTLRQIIRNDSIPNVTILDKPTFKWRGLMLDEGRYFKGEQVVEEIMDEMALLKMNTFHWHLTDDQGWRIEIKKYPKLTEIGSKRRMSETGTWLSNKFDSIPHSGYYNQTQIKDIIKYASARHITIIPEIEMPGHASAAIAAYPWLGAENKQIEVPITFGIKPDVFNVSDARVKTFLHDVLDEIMNLFPSKIIHIGGDEVKFDQWKASADVNSYMKQHQIKTPADLQIDFTNGIASYIDKHHYRMMGWNEILGGTNENNNATDTKTNSKLSTTAIIDFWTGDPKIVSQAAINGYDVVNSYWLFTYLDYDYKATALEKTYRFNPIPDSLPVQYRHKILGLNTQMWGEWIPTVKRMNYLLYPRIAAIAETGWTNPANKDYKSFLNRLTNGYVKKHWNDQGIELNNEQLIAESQQH
jgi:hexosaminidase